ncbi:MAG: hypothetical protein RLZZ196_2850 [Bacteroidota bacterium]|jgi:hypothetical protein
MPQYIKESVWMDILKVFGKAQDQNKQSKLIKNMRKTNPELANAFADWDRKSYDLLQATKRSLQKIGKSTAEVDDLLKDYE